MGIENEIEEHLRQGYTPQQLIESGYKKSTVYKVYKTIKSYTVPMNRPEWAIENIRPMPLRRLPGQKASISLSFKNTSDKEIYLYRIGVRPEWMKESNEWFAQEVRDLIKPDQKRFFTFLLPVPRDIPLGEYEILFGTEAQYLPVSSYMDQLIQTQWSEPLIFHVKHPLTGTKVFISHSTEDLQIVRELEKRLDNYGVQGIIVEDIPKPGAVLEKKIEAKIRESTIFLAILTEDSVRSKWVVWEAEYAQRIGKPLIPLKEKSLSYESSIEWREFSKYEDPDSIFQKVMESIKRVQPTTSPFGVILGVGILAFLAALIFGGSD